jgi:hypothetical protein
MLHDPDILRALHKGEPDGEAVPHRRSTPIRRATDVLNVVVLVLESRVLFVRTISGARLFAPAAGVSLLPRTRS